MNAHKTLAAMSLCLTLWIGTAAVASGFIIIPPPPRPIQRPPVHQPIELRSMTVDVEITDQQAQTTVEQEEK